MTFRDPVRVLLLRKVLETLTALFALILLSFLFLHSIPGGPFDEEAPFAPAVRERLIQQWSLDQSLPLQFGHYFKGLLQLDLGMSMTSPGKSVSDLIGQGLSQTLALNLLAVFSAYVLAFITTVVMTAKNNTYLEKSVEVLSVAGVALPSLFLGPLLIYIFGFYLNLLPTAFLIGPSYYILPVITLTLRPWAQLHLLLTTTLRENLGMDYVRTAKAKGLSRWTIVSKHALRNSLIPILSYSGPLIVGLISGSFLVEILFSIPGLGQQLVESLNGRDYPVIMGLVLFYGASLTILTHVFDVLMVLVDPRLRGEK